VLWPADPAGPVDRPGGSGRWGLPASLGRLTPPSLLSRWARWPRSRSAYGRAGAGRPAIPRSRAGPAAA